MSRTEPQIPGPSAPVKPQPASTSVVSPLQETSPPMKIRASFARIEQPFQHFSEATGPLSTHVHVRSPPQEACRPMTSHDSRPARTEAQLKQTVDSVQSTRVDPEVNTISQCTAAGREHIWS